MRDAHDAERGHDEVGSLGEETAKLLGAFAAWARDSGSDLGAGLGAAAAQAAAGWNAVDEHIDAIEAPLRRLGASEYVLCARILRLAAATARGDTDTWTRMWPDVAERLSATGMVDVDIARPLAGVARDLRDCGAEDAARTVGDVAVRQYRALGRGAEADALEADVGPLGP